MQNTIYAEDIAVLISDSKSRKFKDTNMKVNRDSNEIITVCHVFCRLIRY
jgi:hypothetical protein